MKKRYTFHFALSFVSVLLVQNSFAQENDPFSLDEGRITLRGHPQGFLPCRSRLMGERLPVGVMTRRSDCGTWSRFGRSPD